MMNKRISECDLAFLDRLSSYISHLGQDTLLYSIRDSEISDI